MMRYTRVVCDVMVEKNSFTQYTINLEAETYLLDYIDKLMINQYFDPLIHYAKYDKIT